MYTVDYVMFSVNIVLFGKRKPYAVLAYQINLKMAAMIQPFLYSVNVSFLLWKISKLKSTENNMSVYITLPDLTMSTYSICFKSFCNIEHHG